MRHNNCSFYAFKEKWLFLIIKMCRMWMSSYGCLVALYVEFAFCLRAFAGFRDMPGRSTGDSKFPIMFAKHVIDWWCVRCSCNPPLTSRLAPQPWQIDDHHTSIFPRPEPSKVCHYCVSKILPKIQSVVIWGVLFTFICSSIMYSLQLDFTHLLHYTVMSSEQ